MPDGDAILVIWIKLIALAGKTNDGGYIYISENIPYTEEMLSVIMNKPIMTIKLAMETFASLNMIENDTKGIYLLNFEKHQSLDKLNAEIERTGVASSEVAAIAKAKYGKASVKEMTTGQICDLANNLEQFLLDQINEASA